MGTIAPQYLSLRDLSAKLAYGEGLDGPRTTPIFVDYAEDWIRQINITKKPATAETYTRHMRRIWIPAFGKYSLDQITRSMVRIIKGVG